MSRVVGEPIAESQVVGESIAESRVVGEPIVESRVVGEPIAESRVVGEFFWSLSKRILTGVLIFKFGISRMKNPAAHGEDIAF